MGGCTPAAIDEVVCSPPVMSATTAIEFLPRYQARASLASHAADLTSRLGGSTNTKTRTSTLHHGRRRQNPVSPTCQFPDGINSDEDNRYPKHVWSPAGGWYAQPNNWKANTAVVGAVMACIVGAAWTLSAKLEHRDKMPEPGRFFPSRKYDTLIPHVYNFCSHDTAGARRSESTSASLRSKLPRGKALIHNRAMMLNGLDERAGHAMA